MLFCVFRFLTPTILVLRHVFHYATFNITCHHKQYESCCVITLTTSALLMYSEYYIPVSM